MEVKDRLWTKNTFSERQQKVIQFGIVCAFLAAAGAIGFSLRTPNGEYYSTFVSNSLQVWVGWVHNEEYGGELEVIARSTPLGTLLTHWLHNPAHFEQTELVERKLREFNSLETKERKAEYLFFLFQILWKQESLGMNLTQDSQSVWPTIERLLSPLSPSETSSPSSSSSSSSSLFGLLRHSYENRNQRTLLHFAAMKSSNLTTQLFCSSTSSSFSSSSSTRQFTRDEGEGTGKQELFVNSEDSEGRTALFYASQLEIARSLVEDCGGNINHQDRSQVTVLTFQKDRFKKLRRYEDEKLQKKTDFHFLSSFLNLLEDQEEEEGGGGVEVQEESGSRGRGTSLSSESPYSQLPTAQGVKQVVVYLVGRGAAQGSYPDSFFYF